MEAEKSLVAATHQRDQARSELRRIEQQFADEREETSRLRAEAEVGAHSCSQRSKQTRGSGHTRAKQPKARAHKPPIDSLHLRQDFHSLQEQAAARREELATMSERLTSAESAEQRVTEEMALAGERDGLRCGQQHEMMLQEKSRAGTLPASSLACRSKICAKRSRGSRN